jgi:hypothetical protein
MGSVGFGRRQDWTNLSIRNKILLAQSGKEASSRR